MADGAHQVRDPEELEALGVPAAGSIAAAARPGPVTLTVGDLDRARAFYSLTIGLTPAGAEGPTPAGDAVPGAEGRRSVAMGAGGEPLLMLVEEEGARPPAARATGLYHFALLLPGRIDLARWLAHALRGGIELSGAADHFVSEAVYLADPDGHGIEIYWDRPREHWEGRVSERMTTLPLDVDGLLGELEDPRGESFDGLPLGTTMGHVHLKVAALREAIVFYRDVLGFGLMAQIGSQAAFLSAGGYHHHIGANTWESAGAPPAPAGSAALRELTIVLPAEAEREAVLARVSAAGLGVRAGETGPRVVDPSGNVVRLALAETGRGAGGVRRPAAGIDLRTDQVNDERKGLR